MYLGDNSPNQAIKMLYKGNRHLSSVSSWYKMKAIVFLLGLIAAATAIDHPLLKHFKDDDTRVGRVVGGQETQSAAEIPYQILLLYLESFTCGGSILNENWVLTAAHCIDERPASTLKVQVGTNIADGTGGRRYEVIFATMHPSYGSFTNDIALIKVVGSFEWSNTVQPIAVDSEASATGQQVILSGFGRTVNNGPVAPILKWTYSNLLSRTNCVLGTGITHQGTICYFASSGTGVSNEILF